MRRAKKWKDRDVVHYLLMDPSYDRWRLEDGVVLWITSDGAEVVQMDDIDERSEAVRRFMSSRDSISRAELEALDEDLRCIEY